MSHSFHLEKNELLSVNENSIYGGACLNLPYLSGLIKRGYFMKSESNDRIKLSDINKDLFKKLIKTINESMKKIDNFDSKMKKMKDNFDERINKMNDRIVKLESQIVTKVEELSNKPNLNIEEMIAYAMKKEQKNFDEDQKQFEIYRNDIHYWIKQGKKLEHEIKRLEPFVTATIDNSIDIIKTLPDNLKNDLQNSQSGLNIIGRMLKRLVEPGDRLHELAKDITFKDKLKEPFEDNEWKNIIKGEINDDSAQKKIDKKLKDIGMENYSIVSGLNEIAENRKKKFLNFLTGSILPILDGINDGQKHLINHIENLKEKNIEQEKKLNDWFGNYQNLQNELKPLLVGIRKMDIKLGSLIDFERHEPVGVEPDSEMQNEQIKEITRHGYEYTTYDNKFKVLRAAQVIVVKN
ncbi:HSP70 cofactor GrpE domain-containing protein [Candidatus Magnetomoraceae bacterium gMMP-1]